MYSFVIRKAIDVSKAKLLAIGKPAIGLTIDKTEDTIIKIDLIKTQKFSKNVSSRL